MKRFYYLAIIAMGLLLGGCSVSDDNSEAVEVAKSQLSIGLPIGISRTTIDAEGRASWVEGDTFSLWAENKTGGFNLSGEKFSMMYYWHSVQSAVFTANASALADGEYTYYAVAPTPEKIETKTTAYYTIPAVQQGDSFNGAYDVMVAEPVKAEALSADKVNNLALNFHHKMHILKLTIAEKGFKEPLSQLHFEFPSAVVGTVAVDAQNATATPTVSNSSNVLTVNVPESTTVGDSVYGVVIPGNIDGEVKLTATTSDGIDTPVRTFNLSKELKEGHITPMSLVIPDIIRITTIRFSIGTNNLGEAIQKLHIVDNNGSTIATFNANSSNTYELTYDGYYEDSGYANFGGRTFTARFESANAIVEQQFVMPTVAKYQTTIATINVPYLFYEDFTNIHTSFEKDDERVANLMEANGMLLNNYMYVSGWNGAHIKGVAGQCVRVNVRHQSTGGTTRSNGRLDSPSMKNLKSGANVKLKVEFDMGAYANSGYSSKNGIFCVAGIHRNAESTVLNGVVETTIFSSVSNDAGRVAGQFSSVCLQTGILSSNYNNDSFGSSFPTYSYTANNCSSATRLCWFPCSEQNDWKSITNAHYYLYIDNIRVSIAQ